MNKKEYNTIVLNIKDKVYRFARTLLNDSIEAEDITQDIFERLWVGREKAKQYDNIESFIIQSTRNLCYDQIRHRKVVLKSVEEIKNTNSIYSDEKDEKESYSKQIKDCINQLPIKQKTIMHLRDIEGYDYDEIAQILEMEANAVRVNLSRARKTVKAKLLNTMNYGN